jgi:hypothetical protein
MLMACDALVHLRRALEAYSGLGMPLEAARMRLEVARTMVSGDPEIAATDAGCAEEQLGSAEHLQGQIRTSNRPRLLTRPDQRAEGMTRQWAGTRR